MVCLRTLLLNIMVLERTLTKLINTKMMQCNVITSTAEYLHQIIKPVRRGRVLGSAKEILGRLMVFMGLLSMFFNNRSPNYALAKF